MAEATATASRARTQARGASLEQGLAHCRRGEWERGLRHLSALAQDDHTGQMPGRFYSYLGYAMALCHGRLHEGTRLCEHAVKVEFYQPENYLNLARVRMLAGHRRAAVRAVSRGLAVDGSHKGLRRLRRELGVRRRPVLPFLDRSNPLNVLFGQLRHRLSS